MCVWVSVCVSLCVCLIWICLGEDKTSSAVFYSESKFDSIDNDGTRSRQIIAIQSSIEICLICDAEVMNFFFFHKCFLFWKWTLFSQYYLNEILNQEFSWVQIWEFSRRWIIKKNLAGSIIFNIFERQMKLKIQSVFKLRILYKIIFVFL